MILCTSLFNAIQCMLQFVYITSSVPLLQTMNADVYRGPWGGAHCRDSLAQVTRDCDCPASEERRGSREDKGRRGDEEMERGGEKGKREKEGEGMLGREEKGKCPTNEGGKLKGMNE